MNERLRERTEELATENEQLRERLATVEERLTSLEGSGPTTATADD